MSIIRNSAKCNHCGVELESTHRHDFNTHYCPNAPRGARKWEGNKIVEVPGETTFNFAVDGGKAYIRRVGDPGEFTDTSTFDNPLEQA